jgi:hypothetical protein
MRHHRVARHRLKSSVPDTMTISAQQIAFLGLSQKTLQSAAEVTQRERLCRWIAVMEL